MTGLEIGGNILDELEAAAAVAEPVKLPFTSCSKDPRIDEPPSSLTEPVSALPAPALLSLMALWEAPDSVEDVLRNLGLPTHCWM